MNFSLSIGGVDITPYIANRGLKWQLSDIDSSDAGRTMDGLMHRGRVTSKVRLDVTCRPLTSAEASIVLTAIYPEWLTVTYVDPKENATVTKTMYSNNRPASHLIQRKDGSTYWDGISFPLIEQ